MQAIKQNTGCYISFANFYTYFNRVWSTLKSPKIPIYMYTEWLKFHPHVMSYMIYALYNSSPWQRIFMNLRMFSFCAQDLIFINGWSVKGVQTNRTTDHIHLYCYISRQCFLLPMHVIIGRQYLPLSKRTIRVEHVETLPRSFHILNYMRGRNHRLKKMWVEYVSLLPSPFPPYPCCFLNVRPVPPQF